MKSFYSVLLLAVCGLFTTHASGQDFQLSAEYRPRYEFRNGVWKMRPEDDKQDKPLSVISQRARLNFGFTDKKEKLKLYASLQDVRTWGSTSQLNVDNPNSVDIHQFWAELLFTTKISLKVGRQELNYDYQRMFGATDWVQQARSFDAAVFKFEDEDKKYKMHVGVSYNAKSDTTALKQPYTGINNYKTLQFLWVHKEWSSKLNASLLFLNNGMEYAKDGGSATIPADRKIAFSQTMGGQASYKSGPIGVLAEGYYQTGKDKNNVTLGAWELRAEATASLNKQWSATGGFEFLSGTGQDNNDGKNHSFNPFYGTNHKFNGYMDYFYVGNRQLGSKDAVGLADYYVGARYRNNVWSGELTAHQFSAMATVLDNSRQKMNSNLGFEADLMLGYKFTDFISFQGGYSFILGSETLQQLQPGSDHNKFNSWGWCQMTVNPTIFQHKK